MTQRIIAACTLLISLLLGCQAETKSPADLHDTPATGSISSDGNTALDTTPPRGSAGTNDTSGSVRHFLFTYAGALTDLQPGQAVSVWLPIATDTHEQTILDKQINVPGKYEIHRETRFGNHVLHFQALADQQGEVPFEVVYELERREHTRTFSEPFTENQTEQFTAASTFVPNAENLLDQIIDRKQLDTDPMRKGRQLYDAINRHMRYDKPKGGQWGRGDSVWACGSQHGNCTDFHSLFISICREQDIPARFEIGFPISPQRGQGDVAGYHCWAKFVADKTWIPVDISEADKNPEKADYFFGNLTEDRISFTAGRDLQLVPPQQDGPVNFLVYPYAEVSGKKHQAFRKSFKYSDL